MERKKEQSRMSPWLVYGIIGELAYLIAIPAIVFAFGGAYLDKVLGTVPVFMLLGFALALAASVLAIRRLIRRMNAMTTAQRPSDVREESSQADKLKIED